MYRTRLDRLNMQPSNAVQEAIKPVLLSMGDPAGVGPEIALKALQERPDLRAKLVLAGDLTTLRQALACLLADASSAHQALVLAEVSSLADWHQVPSACVAVVQACEPLPKAVQLGQVSVAAGRAAAQCVQFAARAALLKQASAVVTAPIHKEALAAAGVPYPGHTELLQALAAEYMGCAPAQLPVRMMLSSPGLCTVLVSIHVSLRQAIDAVSTAAVLQTLHITAHHFERMGWPPPRMAVAGLNPHAGEGGLFGMEEIDLIAPAVVRAQAQGLNASGPFAPDTVFMRARQGEFDVVVAMYHDQGLIPVKLMGVEHGVNTTLGLPFIRTSPDHGTAFDLAGTGRASAASLVAAIDQALLAPG